MRRFYTARGDRAGGSAARVITLWRKSREASATIAHCAISKPPHLIDTLLTNLGTVEARRARYLLFLILALFTSLACNADEVRTAKELTFQFIFANRLGDARQYNVVGGGWLRTLQMPNPGEFIAKWLAKHPSATVRPISHQYWTNIHSKVTNEEVYIWVEDGSDSLNVDLIGAGMYPGGIMADMVDQRNGLDELLNDPKLADVKADVEKERADNPQDRVERLITDGEYMALMHRVELVELQARREKRGIWSDKMKMEREADGYR